MSDATPSDSPTVVLVHGAFADGSSWNGVIDRLITTAAARVENVVGLVYVAAFAPDEGERLGDATAASKDAILSSRWFRVPTRRPTPASNSWNS